MSAYVYCAWFFGLCIVWMYTNLEPEYKEKCRKEIGYIDLCCEGFWSVISHGNYTLHIYIPQLYLGKTYSSSPVQFNVYQGVTEMYFTGLSVQYISEEFFERFQCRGRQNTKRFTQNNYTKEKSNSSLIVNSSRTHCEHLRWQTVYINC